MKYLVRFSVEVEIESEAQNDLGIVVDAVKYCLKEERAEFQYKSKTTSCRTNER